MTAPNIYAIRAVVGISMLSGLMLLATSIILFSARVEDLKSYKFPASGVPSNISDSVTEPEEIVEYENILFSLNKIWEKNRPLLVSCSVLSILAGILQLIFSGLVLFCDSKALLLYLKKWMTIHFILVCVLFIILLNTILLSGDAGSKKFWKHLTSKLKTYLDEVRPFNIYTELFSFLETDEHLIYISVGTNLGMILVLMGVMLFLMRNQRGDYESCD